MSTFLKGSKTSKVVASNWLRFLVISSSDEGTLKKLSPFAIQKGLVGLAGEPKHVQIVLNGSLLVECSTEKHSKCLLVAVSLTMTVK